MGHRTNNRVIGSPSDISLLVSLSEVIRLTFAVGETGALRKPEKPSQRSDPGEEVKSLRRKTKK